ncbi:ABC-type nitrate/sulfonate/bicarbonate transport system, ATPase component [Desulfitobacterium dichloroeliminans LMG P-21439]|uniref:ABC-type nitrate/sulfonate/bicarbonate transport system, ATPase component n=1 Tax=Desulfitobacterium dichloroeliminans (strain LMG P-21439 / DCA1) TaxID=871963 RepID=L0FBQ2_DESDL|nr:ABC transporter ATP-binding protein [Desulfitobacterium dichloroeliminans]AGA70378.1 ABC-type nitrate/sulfonate/bicarbonate transport system, ATPase component [Desulfitobacterium dichloroeliminans LMG P-21439]
MGNDLIQLKSVEKYYRGSSKTLKVLENINLHIQQGEILAILGPSGCGKTTLLRQIAGFDHPSSGGVFMDGQEIAKPEVKRMMIFQDFNQLFPWKTVIQNTIYPLQVNRLGDSEATRREIALKYLNLVELSGFEDSYPHQLSGGMKQKAAMARALVIKPKVLLMDEPFGSLDALTRLSLQNLLLKVWRETGVTIVLVTHDIQEAIILSDRIAVMGGRGSGGIKRIIPNQLPRPRAVGAEGYSEVYDQVYSLLDIHSEH